MQTPLQSVSYGGQPHVPFEQITRAYECQDGSQVIVSDLELEAIEPRRTRTIEIEQFVDLEDVDPIYFDHAYFLLPGSDNDGATRAYRLLTEVITLGDRMSGRIPTPELNRFLSEAVQARQPPVGTRRGAGARGGAAHDHVTPCPGRIRGVVRWG